MGVESHWCGVDRTIDGAGAVKHVSILRFTGDGIGVVDVWFLAIEDGAGWHLGPVVGDASYSGVGGWSQALTFDGVTVMPTPEGTVVVARVRLFHEDTDLGTNAQTEDREARVVACLVPTSPGAHRCAVATTHTLASVSKVDQDGETPPSEYGRLGTRTWSRPIAWDAKAAAFTVGKERGKRPAGAAVVPATKKLSATAFLDAFAPKGQ